MINVVVSSPKGLKKELIKTDNIDYIISKYKLHIIKDPIKDILLSSISAEYTSENSINMYIAYKDIYSMDSIYICKKDSEYSERLYQLKCRLISHIRSALMDKELKINQLDFCANLFLNLLPEIKECNDVLLKNDIKWLRSTRGAFKSTFKEDKRDLTDREFRFLVLIGMMSVYAGIKREDSCEYAKDIFNMCSAYENEYLW